MKLRRYYLQHGRLLVYRRSHSLRCYSAVPSFFGQKCRVVTYRSISVLSASIFYVEALNRLDEHVPVLEVRDTMGAK